MSTTKKNKVFYDGSIFSNEGGVSNPIALYEYHRKAAFARTISRTITIAKEDTVGLSKEEIKELEKNIILKSLKLDILPNIEKALLYGNSKNSTSLEWDGILTALGKKIKYISFGRRAFISTSISELCNSGAVSTVYISDQETSYHTTEVNGIKIKRSCSLKPGQALGISHSLTLKDAEQLTRDAIELNGFKPPLTTDTPAITFYQTAPMQRIELDTHNGDIKFIISIVATPVFPNFYPTVLIESVEADHLIKDIINS